MSAEIKKKLEDEIQALEKELREELPRALKTAAALGDLSENADYSAARERQDFVRVRLGQLKQRLADEAACRRRGPPRSRCLWASSCPHGAARPRPRAAAPAARCGAGPQ